MLDTIVKCNPILKWAGGKRQLLPTIRSYLPDTYNKYYEPFVGGGALFFELGHPGSVIVDYNKELINLYKVVKDNYIGLVDAFKGHQTQNTEEYYYKIRNWDRDEEVYNQLSNLDKASRFLYLNKTCFNGLWRVNKHGHNNVPYAYPKSISIDINNIEKCHQLLSTTEIFVGDFEIIKPQIKTGNFVYFDPPYVPLTETSSFTGYTDVGFDWDMQVRLKEFCDYIHKIGAYFMVSNSSASSVYKLYQNYSIKPLHAKRMVNADGNNRGAVEETLIINYAKELTTPDDLLGF